MDPLGLDRDACRARQKRLLERMHARQLDVVIVTSIENVQWLTGARFLWYFQPAAALFADGYLLLVGPKKPLLDAAIDEYLTYEAQWHSTLRNDQRAASSEALLAGLKFRPQTRWIGVEFSQFTQHLRGPLSGECHDIEPDLYVLRRRKHDDELRKIRKAVAGTRRMYERARERIAPGITELELYSELQAAVVGEFGELPTGMGNDYQCGSRGGPPRAGRQAEAGELYILDLGPAFRGYYADNCRTFAVTKPSSEQLEAWSRIQGVFRLVETTVKPGVSARKLFEQAQSMLDEAPLGLFNHHLGHGFGLFPHEAPHLNPNWDDAFEAGDVFTVEPGLYAAELRAGLRLEQNYLVTQQGVELLTDIPLEL